MLSFQKIKRISFLLALLFFSRSAFALAPALAVGAKVGVNLCKLRTNFANEKNTIGYQLGMWGRVAALGGYIQPELYISKKGNKIISITQDDYGNPIQAQGVVRFVTLDLPVLIGTQIGLSNMNLRFMTGPLVSFTLDKRISLGEAFRGLSNFANYKSQAWSLLIGAGIDVARFSIDLRREWGLTNWSRSNKYKQRSNLLSLSLGYKIW